MKDFPSKNILELLEEFGQITIVQHGELFEVTGNPARLKVEV